MVGSAAQPEPRSEVKLEKEGLKSPGDIGSKALQASLDPTEENDRGEHFLGGCE